MANIDRNAAQPRALVEDGPLFVLGHGLPRLDECLLQGVLSQGVILQLDKAHAQQRLGIPLDPFGQADSAFSISHASSLPST